MLSGTTMTMLHTESGLTFIERWGPLQAGRTMKYGDDTANISVRYENGTNCYVSIFVFRAGLRASRKAFEQAHRAGTFDMLRSITAIETCHECSVAYGRCGLRPVLGRRSEVIGRLARSGDGRPNVLLSSFWLYAETDWAVKVRGTCSPGKASLVRGFVAGWLDGSGFGAARQPSASP